MMKSRNLQFRIYTAEKQNQGLEHMEALPNLKEKSKILKEENCG